MERSSLRSRTLRHRQARPRPWRYPEAFRREIVSHVRGRRAQGESIEAAAKGLGMRPFTLYEWLRGRTARQGTPRGPEFRRVLLVPGAPPGAALVTPQGYRLEGDPESLAAVLRALR